MPRDRVLFVCTDGARSLMAAAILAKYGSDRFEPCCAAANPGGLDSRVKEALQEHGVEGDRPWLQPLTNMGGTFRDIMVLDESVSVPSNLAGRVRDWDVPNPVDVGTPAAFAEARDLIEGVLFDWLTRFAEQDMGEDQGPPAPHLASLNSRPNDVRL
ncbi:MAG: hypothetical protein U0836_11320 [Pirellulales bacterium]